MADKKTPDKKPTLEREYVIPLRNEWRKVANYRRAGRAIKFIKQFIAKHMKVPDRDVSKVKLDRFLNQEIWFRGKMKPPAKIKIKAVKEGDIVKVELLELPEYWKFVKAKQERKHKPAPKVEKPLAPKTDEKKEDKKEEKTPEEKKEEKEKSTSSAEQKAQVAATQSKELTKATSKSKQMPIQRKALKK